jgi:histidinol-phosphate/aromatic aminotransferase/cobyric acid decarboxylase-like protein
MEFAVNAVAEKLAIAALKDQEYIEKIREKTSQRRKLLEVSLDKIDGIKYYPSQTQIMLIKHKSKNLYNYLLKEGILVATMEISGLEGKNYIRITIRNEEENNILVNAIKKFFGI